MKHVQITNLSPLPEDEHFQLGLEWCQQTIALSCGVPGNAPVSPRSDNYGPSLLEKIKEVIVLLEVLEGRASDRA